MEIVLQPGRIEVRAKASVEEAFVAEAFSDAKGGGLPEVWNRHGAYLVAHLHILADGAPLTGRLIRVVPPADTSIATLVEYDLQYDLPPEKSRPAELLFRQDVLNEYEFAPGNRWEATYVTRFRREGEPPGEIQLFTSRGPMEHHCDWGKGGQAKREEPSLFGAYVMHGVMHILTGYDHVLFMAALVLAVVTLGDLVKVVTAFTIAHTVTLTLAVLNIVRIPFYIVEPMVAASIVVTALQNVFWPRQTRGWSRYALAFGFGLFHGLGFAGGLLVAMEGMPGLAIATAITAFSLGVELGHQSVVLPLYSAMELARRSWPPQNGRDLVRQIAMRYGSALICLAGLVYFWAAMRRAMAHP